MATLKKINQELKTISTINLIANIYQEIAHLRMAEIRQRVLQTREFLEQLTYVYNLIKKSYFAHLETKSSKKKNSEKSFFIKKKKNKILIFLSVNEIFYGTLILNIWKKVLEYIEKNETDLAVVGKVGKYLAENNGLGDKIFYFELNDDKPEKDKIQGIINFIKEYEKISVIHGKFETILSQTPTIIDISESVSSDKETGELKKYLFEPSPKKVLEFFETEIVSTIFNQTVLEHKLARYAARMVSMYQAGENAKKTKVGLEKIKNKLWWQTLDKKQSEIFSSFNLWNQKAII